VFDIAIHRDRAKVVWSDDLVIYEDRNYGNLMQKLT